MKDIFVPGAWCDGHEIVRLAGRGGFAEVYEVLDPNRARRAIKVLSTEPGLASKIQARFAQEGHAISRIDHPNVVRFFRSAVYQDRIYLVLEYVAGMSLLQRMAQFNGFVPIEDIVRWIRDACHGMEAAHKHGIIHRDLKPSNILITDSDAVKVIDFGVAKLQGCGVRTTSEQGLGTALFMAPERLKHVDADVRTDVYSMGVILYQALGGVHPMGYNPKNVHDVVMWQLSGKRPRRLRELAKEVTPRLEWIVHRALATDPGTRQSSMLELANDLDAELRILTFYLRKAALEVLPSKDPVLAPTAALPAMDPARGEAARDAVLPPTPRLPPEPSAATSGRTQAMPVAEARARDAQVPRASRVEVPGARTELLPISMGTPFRGSPLAATLPLDDRGARESRTAREQLASTLPMNEPSAPMTLDRHRATREALAGTLPMDGEASSPGERGSTGIPVESRVTRPTTPRRALPAVAVAGALVAVVLAAWLLFGASGGVLERVPASGAVSAQANPSASLTSAVAPPTTSGTAIPRAQPSTRQTSPPSRTAQPKP